MKLQLMKILLFSSYVADLIIFVKIPRFFSRDVIESRKKTTLFIACIIHFSAKANSLFIRCRRLFPEVAEQYTKRHKSEIQFAECIYIHT